MSNLVKKDPAYELIKEMINGALFERGPLIGKRGQITKTGQKVLDITDLSSITDLPISELGWTKIMTPEDGGEINEVGDNQRRQLEEYLTHIEGQTLKEKVEYINGLFNMSPEQIESSDMFGSSQSEKIQKVLAYLVFMKSKEVAPQKYKGTHAGIDYEIKDDKAAEMSTAWSSKNTFVASRLFNEQVFDYVDAIEASSVKEVLVSFINKNLKR